MVVPRESEQARRSAHRRESAYLARAVHRLEDDLVRSAPSHCRAGRAQADRVRGE